MPKIASVLSQRWILFRPEEASVTLLGLFHDLICNCKCSAKTSEGGLSDLGEVFSFHGVCLLVSD